MKKEDWKKIFYQSLTGFVSLALAILLFFAIREIGQIKSSFLWLLGVLKPVIYGGVMAYLLKTPCNFLEKKIEVAIYEHTGYWMDIGRPDDYVRADRDIEEGIFKY